MPEAHWWSWSPLCFLQEAGTQCVAKYEDRGSFRLQKWRSTVSLSKHFQAQALVDMGTVINLDLSTELLACVPRSLEVNNRLEFRNTIKRQSRAIKNKQQAPTAMKA
ncbi:hypothetical protein WJX79_004614 [Trebouxia sp. C0005]